MAINHAPADWLSSTALRFALTLTAIAVALPGH